MRPFKTAFQAVFWTLILCLFQKTQATGVFELQIRSFQNDLGLTSNGTCCNGFRVNGICSETCKTLFKVCLSHYQADIASSAHPTCTFGSATSPVLGDNTMDFREMSDLSLDVSRQNTFKFDIKETTWPGDFSLIIEAWHESPDTPNGETLVSRLAEIRTAHSDKEWTPYDHKFNYSMLTYAFRFTCDKNYYGAKCDVFCRPRDDQFIGHFSCSANGTKVCLDGWSGEYCDEPICLSGCHSHNGFCNKPNECKCRLGWQGQYCDECIPYPGCLKGSCTKPWQCKCNEGWGGTFCNQDLNFCTRQKPCRNGGICTNSGEGSYTCECVGSYAGVNCERELDDCKNKPCANNGVCKDIGDGFQCQCPKGFYGRQCQNEAMSCRTNPCENGGSCQEKEDSYVCFCRPGFSGYNCDTEINECESDPCQNGGRCVDQLNGYRCVCPTGFSGEDCQHNEDDCHHSPCHNGGTCIDMVNDFRCQCVAGFVGTLCQDNVDECDMMPCANGGQCVDGINDYSCKCALGFEGKDCSDQINMCRSSPCLHGGKCENSFADYTCTCPPGFYGKNCQYCDGCDNNDGDRTARPVTADTTTIRSENTGVSQGSARDDEDGAATGMTMTQLLLIVCLGVGIPLILIIIAVTFLLCRKRSYLQRSKDDHQNRVNSEKEQNQNIINNINNKKDMSPDIFTTPLPSSASNSSSIKISNEDQQDINKLKHKQLMLGAGDVYSELNPGTSKSCAVVMVTDGMHTSSSKQFFHEMVKGAHRDLPSPTSTDSCSMKSTPNFSPVTNISPSNFPPPSCSSTKPSNTSNLKGGRRSSDNDYDYDKPYRSLDVDSLQADTRRPKSELHPHHSLQAVVHPPDSLQLSRDSSSPSSLVVGYPAPSVPRALTPQQLQQRLAPIHHRHSHYDEDFLATEV